MQGKCFTHDAAKVKSYIICLISENTVAEQKFLPHEDNENEREEFLALKDFYEGVVENVKVVLAAEKDIQELYYAGKKKPHMWWDKFDIRLTNAFYIFDKEAGRQVRTGKSKLSLLNKMYVLTSSLS